MLVVPAGLLAEELTATLDYLGVLSCMLFVVDVDPDPDTNWGDLTPGQPSWCAPQEMSMIGGPSLDGWVAVAQWEPVTFTNDGVTSVDVYGYAVVLADSSLLRWSERDPAAPVTVPPGGNYVVVPYYSRKNQGL